MPKVVSILLIVLGVGLIIWMGFGYIFLIGVKEPSHQVLEKRDGYDIRYYDDYIIAETSSSGQYRQTQNSNFSKIGGFIFGDNTSQEKVAMTTPVLTENQSEKVAMTIPVITENTTQDTYTMAFVMPAEYTLDTLPIPNNSAVNIRKVPGRKVAVLRFTGVETEQKVNQKIQKLASYLERDQVKTTGAYQAAFYNTPGHFPWLRRNEIWVDVK